MIKDEENFKLTTITPTVSEDTQRFFDRLTFKMNYHRKMMSKTEGEEKRYHIQQRKHFNALIIEKQNELGVSVKPLYSVKDVLKMDWQIE